MPNHIRPANIGQVAEAIFLSSLATHTNGIDPASEISINTLWQLSFDNLNSARFFQCQETLEILRRTCSNGLDILVALRSNDNMCARYVAQNNSLIITQNEEDGEGGNPIIYYAHNLTQAIITSLNAKTKSGDTVMLEEICQLILPCGVPMPNLPILEIANHQEHLKIVLRDPLPERPWEDIEDNFLERVCEIAKKASDIRTIRSS